MRCFVSLLTRPQPHYSNLHHCSTSRYLALGARQSSPVGFPRVSHRAGSSQAGDHDSGHIEAGANEAILFFDNVFPLRLQWLLRFPLYNESYIERIENPSAASFDPVTLLKKALPENSLKITGVLPRLKEGGAYVKFSHDDSISADQIEGTIRDYLEAKHKIRPWWNPLSSVQARLVRGKPWVEDLYRPPSSRLKVEFIPKSGAESAMLPQEQLYSIFRPYGKLREITSQPPDSKILPKYAYVDFAQTKRAITAKACLHNLSVTGEDGPALVAKLKLSYERKARANWIGDWIFGHPRIVIPILAALVAATTVAVFDPIRTFYIKTHITRVFDITDNKVYRWFATRATDLLTFRRRSVTDVGVSALTGRQDNIAQLERWLMESADTFIVVQGPRGSGKHELVVNQALKHRKNKLVIDCKPIQEARGDSATIKAAADQVGYRPLFSWMNSFSGLIDLAAQGATGIKTGFSETLDTQLNNILNNTATALKEIALEDRSKDEKDSTMSDDVYLESHPERLPVVIIDNFLHKSQESSIVYDKLAEWAARLATSNVAHVIFLTTDVAFSKSLSKALPDRIFRGLTLGDIPVDAAKRYVLTHLQADISDALAPLSDDPTAEKPLTLAQCRTDLGELDDCITCLGGRLTDLEFLARRIAAGETPKRAVHEIVDQAASEILKMYLLANSGDAPQRRQWTTEQAWTLIKMLARSDALRYHELLLSDAFKGADADAVLQSLEQAELVTIVSTGGRPASVRAGKPVYLAAFRQLTGDKVLAARMDLALLNKSIGIESAGVEKGEAELKALGKLPKQPVEVGGRVQYLLGKLQTSQEKIEKYEVEAAALKKVLQTEF